MVSASIKKTIFRLVKAYLLFTRLEYFLLSHMQLRVHFFTNLTANQIYQLTRVGRKTGDLIG